jgi:hypothetical protein
MSEEKKIDEFQGWLHKYMGDKYDNKIYKQKTLDSIYENYKMYKDNVDFEFKSILTDVIFDIMKKPVFLYTEKLNMLEVIKDNDKMIDELYFIILKWNLEIMNKFRFVSGCKVSDYICCYCGDRSFCRWKDDSISCVGEMRSCYECGLYYWLSISPYTYKSKEKLTHEL